MVTQFAFKEVNNKEPKPIGIMWGTEFKPVFDWNIYPIEFVDYLLAFDQNTLKIIVTDDRRELTYKEFLQLLANCEQGHAL